MTTITVTLKAIRFEVPRALQASHAFACKPGGAAVDLTVSKPTCGAFGRYVGDGYVVRWNATRGRGWMKGWKKSFDTLEEAAAFAATKWPVMLRWLARAESKPGGLPGDWTCLPGAGVAS